MQHAANTTCPDITYSTDCLSAFIQDPRPAHWKAMQHLLAYLKGTLDYKIIHRWDVVSRIQPIGWYDVDYTANLDTRHSTSGEVFMMLGGPVS
jgi:hypothetical protein